MVYRADIERIGEAGAGNEKLRVLAQVPVRRVRERATIDWEMKASTRVGLRLLVCRLLRKYGYPEKIRDEATMTVLQQAEQLSHLWTA